MRRAILLAVLAVAAACGPADRPLLIGAVYPTGGGQGMGGTAEYRGVQLAAELANSEGGVLGRRLEVRLEPADSAEGAPDAIARLVDAGAGVVLGSYGSTISRPAADEASRRGVVFWETGAVGDLGPVGDRVFRVAPTGASLGSAAVGFANDQLLPKLEHEPTTRYAVTYVDDVYGRSVGLGAAAEIRRRGLPLADVFPYDLADVSYPELARDIARARTDVLIVAAYLEDGIGLRRAMVKQRVPLVASVGTSSSYCMHAFGQALGADAVGLYASDKPDGETLDPTALRPDAARAFRWARAEYARRFHHPMTAAGLAGFAAAWGLFRHVLPAAGSDDPGRIARAARSIQLPRGALPNGSGLRFEPKAGPDNTLATTVIWEWVRKNTRAVVWPPELSTSPIVPIAL